MQTHNFQITTSLHLVVKVGLHLHGLLNRQLKVPGLVLFNALEMTLDLIQINESSLVKRYPLSIQPLISAARNN